MTLLTVLFCWAIGCIALCLLNARFWTLFADLEDTRHKQNKAENKPSINPIIQDTWHTVKVFLLIGLLCAVIWMICNAI